MSHKVHPKSFRIKGIADWDSRGFYGKKIPLYLEEDFKIRNALQKKIGKAGIEKIEIERSAGKTSIIISSARPGFIIGRGGSGVEEIKKYLQKIILKSGPSFTASAKRAPEKQELKLEIKEIKNPWVSAALSGQWMASQIEKRVPHRKVLKQVLEKIMAQKGIQGARAEVAGRLEGAQIARTGWLKKGNLPRQTLRADIDYARERAYCTYGVIGIKVWIYKGEKFDQ